MDSRIEFATGDENCPLKVWPKEGIPVLFAVFEAIVSVTGSPFQALEGVHRFTHHFQEMSSHPRYEGLMYKILNDEEISSADLLAVWANASLEDLIEGMKI